MRFLLAAFASVAVSAYAANSPNQTGDFVKITGRCGRTGAAIYIDKILKAGNPADLLAIEPNFDFTTAKQIGIRFL